MFSLINKSNASLRIASFTSKPETVAPLSNNWRSSTVFCARERFRLFSVQFDVNTRFLCLGILAAFCQAHGQALEAGNTVSIMWGGQPDRQTPGLKPVAVGEWSEPASDNHGNMLRGRITIYRGGLHTSRTDPSQLGWTAAPVYLEMEDLGRTNRFPTQVYLDPRELNYELRDTNGQSVRRSPGRGSGGMPDGFWAQVPPGGILRFRVNTDRVRSAGPGDLPPNAGDLNLEFMVLQPGWFIPAGDTNVYLFSAATSFQPPNPVEGISNAWQGTLVFPPVSLTNSP